jgi:tetratricopeptide (TPR) repeat protein
MEALSRSPPAEELEKAGASLEAKRLDEAERHLQLAVEADPAASTRAGAMLYEFADSEGFQTELGERALEAAESRLEEVAQRDAPPVTAILKLADVRAGRKLFRKALRTFRRALEAAPDLPEARIGIAEMANELEDYRQAIRAVEPAIEQLDAASGDANAFRAGQARVVRVEALDGLRDWELARAGFAQLLAKLEAEPFDRKFCDEVVPRIKVQDSHLLLQLGRFDEAVAVAEEAVDTDTGRPFALLALIGAHREQGDYQELAATLVRADAFDAEGLLHSEDDDERVAVVRLRVAVLDAKGRANDAYELLRSEVERMPYESGLRMDLVQLLARERQAAVGAEAARWQHRLIQAVDAARRQLARREDLPSVGLSLGALEILGGTVEDACQRLLREAERDPASDQVHALLGASYASLGENSRACDSFATAVRLAPHNIVYKTCLATLYVRLENSAAAEGCYREVLTRAPANIEALVGLGAVLGAREEAEPDIYAEADELLTRALLAGKTMDADLSRQRGSIRLSKARRAAIFHEIGVVRTRQFEAEAEFGSLNRRPRLLRSARHAFAQALEEDDAMFRAGRAKSRLDREFRALGIEPPRWALPTVIGSLLAILASAFLLHAPDVPELTGPVYSALTLGLLVLLMASFYLDRLRSLTVAGVSLEKDVEAPVMARRLGVEGDPNIIELLQIPINPSFFWPALY